LFQIIVAIATGKGSLNHPRSTEILPLLSPSWWRYEWRF